MILMGRIVAPFGVQGWLKVHPLGDDPLSWRKMSQWWLGKDPESQHPEDWQPYQPRGIRLHGKGVVLAVEGVLDRTAAEAIDGWYIAAPREALPQTAHNEYYWTDLIGLTVQNASGLVLGRVQSLLETGAHAVLEVVEGEQVRLIPFVEAYVKDVDKAAGQIQVEWESDW